MTDIFLKAASHNFVDQERCFVLFVDLPQEDRLLPVIMLKANWLPSKSSKYTSTIVDKSNDEKKNELHFFISCMEKRRVYYPGIHFFKGEGNNNQSCFCFISLHFTILYIIYIYLFLIIII